MGEAPTGPAVTVPGAACRLRPSPTAAAVRLDGLRARDGAALDALASRLPEPPWDAEVPSGDPLEGVLRSRGFEVYAQGALMARPVEGLPPPSHVDGVEILPYRNEWATPFGDAERAAMDGLAAFRELGSPSGYEWGEGQGAFVVARRRDGSIAGFAHADLPDGWLDWMGVVPDRRRRGIGRALVQAIGERVRAANGTHVVGFAETADAAAFLRALGFTERGRRTLLIRRA
jgi:GNAT superfamily N-acetyltransferase